MPRNKIVLPTQFIAAFHIPVRITDINYGNHVGNDAFVAIVHEARMQWLQQYDYTELEIEGIGLIMNELAVDFKNESLYGDVVEVKIAVGEQSKVSFELFYQLSTNRANETVVLAHAKTGMVCFDYSLKKVTAIPEKLKSILAG